MNTLQKALFIVHEFCANNYIEYSVTGTMALRLLGFTPCNYIPGDIDIKVYNITEEQTKKLKELQALSNMKPTDENYNGICYSFIVNGVKVNAIVDKSENTVMPESNVTLAIDEYEAHRQCLIPVQKVNFALLDKAKLRRRKDKDFMLNLIKEIAAL